MSTKDRYSNKMVVSDLAVIFVSSIIVYLLTGSLDFFEKVATVFHEYKGLGLGNWITASFFLVLSLAVFFLRRWREACKSEKKLIVQNNNLRVELGKIKQLSEILPICLHCKKIRDDHDHWHEIEAYFFKHLGTEFSHGVCPDCLRQHYPDMQDDES